MLRAHDSTDTVDVVEYHPAYHELMRTSLATDLDSGPWADPRLGPHVARAAKVIVWYQADAGHICPVSMTYAVVPALRHQAEVAEEWEPMISFDHLRPGRPTGEPEVWGHLRYGPHRKQGGSDVRANTTRALPVDGHRRDVCVDRAQVVLLGADVRRLFDAGSGSRRGSAVFWSPGGILTAPGTPSGSSG